MIVHITVDVTKQDGKWVGHWTPQGETAVSQVFEGASETHEVIANRREELERKLDKALRLAFPKASYIVQHRENAQPGCAIQCGGSGCEI